MKTISICNLDGAQIMSCKGNTLTVCGETIEADDDYHTFDELYEHRAALVLALARLRFILSKGDRGDDDFNPVWCSKLHSDGTMYDGWFVIGFGLEPGDQITYHLPMKYWGHAIQWAHYRDRAPEWDGHTSQDVLKRLERWY